MQETNFTIDRIPAVLYGEDAGRVWLFVHGKCGCKEEARAFAELACPKGWQVLAVDLPGHGARRDEAGTFDPWHAVPELRAVWDYARPRWTHIALRATSLGAWFSMLALADEPLEKCLFVSPVLDMARLIRNMMGWAGVTEAELEARQAIETAFGETLSWPYYQYALAHPIASWLCPTAILYAERDDLTERPVADAFAARFGCGLTVVPDGEHWFHTPAQLDALRRWEEANI